MLAINLKTDKPQIFYIWGHSYEFARGKNRWFVIEDICKLIANQPDIWYATNGEIALYVQACEAAKKASKFPEIVNPTDLITATAILAAAKIAGAVVVGSCAEIPAAILN